MSSWKWFNLFMVPCFWKLYTGLSSLIFSLTIRFYLSTYVIENYHDTLYIDTLYIDCQGRQKNKKCFLVVGPLREGLIKTPEPSINTFFHKGKNGKKEKNMSHDLSGSTTIKPTYLLCSFSFVLCSWRASILMGFIKFMLYICF